MVTGHSLMRAGRDYVNNNKRYDRAYKFLTRAFSKANEDASTIDKARLCLWIGITLNENVDIDPPVKRNDDAIEWYKRGLGFIKGRKDPESVVLRASLYNSLGVAYHHRYNRWNGGPIPAKSFAYYNKARELIFNYPQLQVMRQIDRQIDHNTGGLIGGGGRCNVVVAANQFLCR